MISTLSTNEAPSIVWDLLAAQPYPLAYVCLSGAHAYGFAAGDSDYDVRAVHILPVQEMLGLHDKHQTLRETLKREAFEAEIVSHDARKFCLHLLEANGYALEMALGPYALKADPAFEELRDIAAEVVCTRHARHYVGFAKRQWKLTLRLFPYALKSLLYIYRILLTGNHLMKTGEVEIRLPVLAEAFELPFLHDMIRLRAEEGDGWPIPQRELNFHRAEVGKWMQSLDDARKNAQLPELPGGFDRLDAWARALPR